ncbi:helix-turn-helix domain-containing protein [Bifidobacterium avesanii]|uniref:helix-turn-helix domain-containing protein n=1 Tax=Bifidobacterium avesanii TaxID=1798157 RepID=UPI0013856E62|nr:helix-turn-helix domain-containing protein [Bifidobacterium avesanii]KAB8287270.1 integrase [Bifidobacterium avesanii]
MDTQSQQQPTQSNGNGTARGEFLRNKAIVNAILSGMPVAEAARLHGVSRQWAHELKHRWEAEDDAGLLPRPRRARRIANRTDPKTARHVVEIRRELDSRGLDSGPESIAARLEREGVKPPANSTIHRILKDAGLVRPEPRKRPRPSYTRFEAALPNETWQSDFTH